jgi:hypothetical protein
MGLLYKGSLFGLGRRGILLILEVGEFMGIFVGVNIGVYASQHHAMRLCCPCAL